MCGIIGLLRPCPEELRDVELAALQAQLEKARDAVPDHQDQPPAILEGLTVARQLLEAVAETLRGVPGAMAVRRQSGTVGGLKAVARASVERVARLERLLDDAEIQGAPNFIESVNRQVIAIKDLAWAIEWDRVTTFERALALAPDLDHPAGVAGLLSIQQALQAIDRMEVRGRDSAGLQLLVTGHLLTPELLASELVQRGDALFRNRTVRVVGSALSLVYKTAAEIGELGDNVRELRHSIAHDTLLHAALASDSVEVTVLGHTRWASIGIVSEPNAHPLDEVRAAPAGEAARDPLAGSAPLSPDASSSCFAVLNGDVDNYGELMQQHDLEFHAEISTDAKVIPALCSAWRAKGRSSGEAFRETVASFEGSVAIAALFGEEPRCLHLALHGSGQALYVGVGEDCFIVASELYGVVEETATYLRLDGETPGNPDNPGASRGQIVSLDLSRGVGLEGIRRWAYDGTTLPLRPAELRQAEMTTRDVDRSTYPHFLLKELSEAPLSWAKTLRGRLEKGADGFRVTLPPESLPRELVQALREDRIRRILVIGQGTAAVAGQAIAAAMRESLAAAALREIVAMPATELSGFGLRPDMSDVLVVAISQSGTTTDTNRTVDLVRGRGAAALGIVNRRQSDLTDKVDGVIYTSDGRDLEMSVASTKAFYSQVAAGFLLAEALAAELGLSSTDQRQELLAAMRELPEALRRLLQRREEIAIVARRYAPRKRYWAVVGNGVNRIAAQEVRIKLSELCYKSISCDATEDKKHIDLSCEPLILVAAAGLVGSIADDVSKEVAIYRAHKATPIVIASEGEQRFQAACATIAVPRVHPRLDFVLSAMAGHLFGYEAAKAIDEGAKPLRAMRSEIERLASSTFSASQESKLSGLREDGTSPHGLVEDPLRAIRGAILEPADQFTTGLDEGVYDGHLEASTAADLLLLLHTALGRIPLEGLAQLRRQAATPAIVLDELHDALSQAIDELTRPIDAIKHQAKTVTVGISRSDEAFLAVKLVREVLAAGISRDHLSYACLRTLATLDPVVREVRGHTRYVITGDASEDAATIRVVQAQGVSSRMASRTAKDPTLRGTKRAVAREGEPLVARGSSDGRLFLLVPELGSGNTEGLLLLHLTLEERAPAAVVGGVLRGYRGRYSKLRDAVMETEPTFREELLGELPLEQLLVESIQTLAQRWRAPSEVLQPASAVES